MFASEHDAAKNDPSLATCQVAPEYLCLSASPMDALSVFPNSVVDQWRKGLL